VTVHFLKHDGNCTGIEKASINKFMATVTQTKNKWKCVTYWRHDISSPSRRWTKPLRAQKVKFRRFRWLEDTADYGKW